MKNPVVPVASVRTFKQGQHCPNSLPGDMILVVHHGIMPEIIRFGQRIRYYMMRNILGREEFKKEYCVVNHAMIVVEGGPNAKVTQMEAKGGTTVELVEYQFHKYAVVSPTNVSDEQRLTAARFARWCEHIKYGWFSIFGCTIDILIPVIAVALASGQRMICSTSSALAHRCVGLIPDRADASVLPADLARYYDVKL